MLNSEFLEQYPLYRKFRTEAVVLNQLEAPAVHMYCSICGSEQTFTVFTRKNLTLEGNRPPRGVMWYIYRCASCKEFLRNFLLKFDPEGNYVMKVGQEPPWDISPDQALEKALGDRADYYRKGLVCESQGYGIGAFSYYRRIVEEVIDDLLTEISALLTGE